jgi:phosphatidate cytidylyltransferase
MVAIAGTALWVGGLVWQLFAGIIGFAVFIEWMLLVVKFEHRSLQRSFWLVGGLTYIGSAAGLLGLIRLGPEGFYPVLIVLLGVIFTDVGAYAAGKAIGGPKIAPSISPSKTWAGLSGGMAAAAVLGVVWTYFSHQSELAEHADYVRQHGIPDDWYFQGWRWGQGIIVGCGVALVAQVGDFFQSWMKRRAGVKDSGKLIPGHGGIFDRVDGLIAVLFVIAIFEFGKFGDL